MGAVAVDEHALRGQVGRVDRARVPGKPSALGGEEGLDVDVRDASDLAEEVARRADADRHRLDGRLAERLLEPAAGGARDLGVEADVEVGVGQAREVGAGRVERGDDVDVDADAPEQSAHLDDVVAAAEAEARRADQVRARPARRGRRAVARVGAVRGRRRGALARGVEQQRPHQRVEGLARAPVLLLRVGGELERHDRNRQAEPLRERPRLVLDELRGARLADEQRVRAEALVGGLDALDDEPGGVAAEVARLEGRVRDRRAVIAALDHREQEVRVGVALRGVQHVVHVEQGVGDAHRPDVGRPFVGPDRELHRVRPRAARGGRAAARRARRGRRPARTRAPG